MEFCIRACTLADLEILREAWPLAGDIHRHHMNECMAGGNTYLVAWGDARPMGSALLRWLGCVGESARRLRPSAVELIHLQVRESARGMGAGTALVHHAIGLATQAGVPEIALSADIENKRASELYVRLGFQPTGIRDSCTYSYIDNGGESRTVSEVNELYIKLLPSQPEKVS